MRSSSATGDLACAVTRWLPVSPSAHVPGREVPKSSGARLRPLRAHGAAPAAPEALAGSVLVLCRTLAPWARVHLGSGFRPCRCRATTIGELPSSMVFVTRFTS